LYLLNKKMSLWPLTPSTKIKVARGKRKGWEPLV